MQLLMLALGTALCQKNCGSQCSRVMWELDGNFCHIYVDILHVFTVLSQGLVPFKLEP